MLRLIWKPWINLRTHPTSRTPTYNSWKGLIGAAQAIHESWTTPRFVQGTRGVAGQRGKLCRELRGSRGPGPRFVSGLTSRGVPLKGLVHHCEQSLRLTLQFVEWVTISKSHLQAIRPILFKGNIVFSSCIKLWNYVVSILYSYIRRKLYSNVIHSSNFLNIF